MFGVHEREGIGGRKRRLHRAWGGIGGDEGRGLIELLAGHEVRELFATRSAGGIAGSQSAGIPGVGSDVIERHAFTQFVEIGEVGLRAGESFFGGETDEASGFGVVNLNSNTVIIKKGELTLRFGQAGIGGEA